MNANVSQNFLLMKDYEQIQILQYLSKDFRKKYLFNHLQYLYSLKIKYINNLKRKEPVQKIQSNNPQKTLSRQDPQPKNLQNQISRQDPQPKNIQDQTPRQDPQLKNIQNQTPKQDSQPKNPKKQVSISEISQNTIVLRPNLDFSKFVKNFLVTDKLMSIVANKTIAIIGPAQYLENIDQGNKIDSYDIVIRFNASISIDSSMTSKIGNRTDVWIYNFKNINILSNLPEKLPQLIFCPYPKESIKNSDNIKNLPEIPIEFIENDFFQQLLIALKFEPNSFLLVLLILLRQNVKSIYVSGFSFLYDGYYDGRQSNETSTSNALITNKENRTGAISVVKKIFNANDKLFLDNTMINLIYPNFISVLNKLFHPDNHKKLFSTMDYVLFVPSFQKKYNSPNTNQKIYLHFGENLVPQELSEKMHIIIHSVVPKLFANEIYIKHSQCDYDDLEILLKTKNKGIIYFSNNQWNAIKNMISDKNRDYIMSHHCYANGNIYGSFIKFITNDFDIDEDNKNLNMLYVLFCFIYYGQKRIYVSYANMESCGLKEIGNVMKKLNLIQYI
jgi:hypothetical protein